MHCSDGKNGCPPHWRGDSQTKWASSNPLLTALAGKSSRNTIPLGTNQQNKKEQDTRPQQDQQEDHQHQVVLHRQRNDQHGHENHLQAELQKPRRSLCKTCVRPQRVCICKALAAVGGPISLADAFTGVLEAVVVYVHPLETKRKLRSLTLLQQLVKPVYVFSGRKPIPVEQLLPLDHPRNLLLLFPTVGSRPLPVAPYEHSRPLAPSLSVPAAAAGATEGFRAICGPTGGRVREVSRSAVYIAEENATSGVGCRATVTSREAVSRLAAPATDPVLPASASASVACVGPASGPLAVVFPSDCAALAADDSPTACDDSATAQPAPAPAAATLRAGSVSRCLRAPCFPLQLPLTLICLDGTWKECKEMFRSVEWLQHLPAVHLVFPSDSNSAEQQQRKVPPGHVWQHQRDGQQPKKQQQHLEETGGEQGFPDQGDDTEKRLDKLERVRKRPTQQLRSGPHDTQQSNTKERKAANWREEQKRSPVLIERQDEANECELPQEQQPMQQDLDDHDTQLLSEEQRTQQMHHQQKPPRGLQETLQGHGGHHEECCCAAQGGPFYQQQKSRMGTFSSVRTPPAAIAGAGGVCTAEAICHTMAAIARYTHCTSNRALRCDEDMCQLLKYVAQQQHDCRQETQRHGSSAEQDPGVAPLATVHHNRK